MNKKALLALSIAVLIPLVSYFWVKQASDKATAIPHHYLPDTVISHIEKGRMTDDTVWHRVANFHLVNQLGDTVSLYDLQGKLIVMDFFFTSCGSVCPQLTGNMLKMQQSFAKGGDVMSAPDSSIVQFISFSIDPETDSAARLKNYADYYGIDPGNWWLLTGDRNTIYNYAFEQLKVDKFDTVPINPDFVHTTRFVLIDKNFNVRGYYNGLDSSSLDKLSKDIGLLMVAVDDNPQKLPFDPVLMAIFFAITVVVTIVVIRLIFRKKNANESTASSGNAKE
ncbi:SCO family protein [Parafilimonas sp.]|uniref:SCO family protein n=1 Tax=Parafilimonas sp. TaxID=1969739 RepID=UPI0039E64342